MSLIRRSETAPAFGIFSELDEMRRRMESLFANEGNLFAHADWIPTADISETDKEYRVHAALPDVEKENVQVGIENGVLTLSGERKSRKEEKNERVHRIETVQGSFYRSFALPPDADPEQVTAHFHDGVLDISVAKSKASAPNVRKIEVQ